MRKSKSKSLPKFDSLSELVGFFDSHDMGDYWDQMPEADFDINIKTKKYLIAVDKEIIPKLNRMAKSKKIPAEKLVNTWLREKLAISKRA
jgi:hypothetical protein